MERHQLSGGLRLMTPPSVNRAFASRFRDSQRSGLSRSVAAQGVATHHLFT